MQKTSAYYYQNRKGKRVRVRKGKNRLNVYNGTKVKRVAGRVSIPTRKGEIYGKGVLSVGDRSETIKKSAGLNISTRNDGLKVTGRAGTVKGGAAVAIKRGRKIDTLNYSNDLDPAIAVFNSDSATYKRRSKSGKMVVVRKGRRKKNNQNLIRSAELLGTAAGLTAGAKGGAALVKAAGRNGMIQNAVMGAGGLAGGAMALMLVDRATRKYE